MHLRSFQPGIDQTQAKLLELREALRGITKPEQRAATEEAIEELATTLEELRVADEELRRQNEELVVSQGVVEAERRRYAELFELAPTGYIITDAAGLIREANRAAEALLGYERGGLTGKPLALFFRERDTRYLSDQMSRARSERENRAWDSWVHAQGSDAPLAVSVTLAPIVDVRTSAVAGFRLLIQDLTETMKNKDRIRDLEDGLWRRVAERTARLAEENERLKLAVAQYLDRCGGLPNSHARPEPTDAPRSAAGGDSPARSGESDPPNGTRGAPER